MANLNDDVLNQVSQAILDVVDELHAAVEKHGVARTPLNPYMSEPKRFIILAEEVGEVARALTDDEGSEENYERELIQVAAMAVASVVGYRRLRGKVKEAKSRA